MGFDIYLPNSAPIMRAYPPLAAELDNDMDAALMFLQLEYWGAARAEMKIPISRFRSVFDYMSDATIRRKLDYLQGKGLLVIQKKSSRCFYMLDLAGCQQLKSIAIRDPKNGHLCETPKQTDMIKMITKCDQNDHIEDLECDQNDHTNIRDLDNKTKREVAAAPPVPDIFNSSTLDWKFAISYFNRWVASAKADPILWQNEPKCRTNLKKLIGMCEALALSKGTTAKEIFIAKCLRFGEMRREDQFYQKFPIRPETIVSQWAKISLQERQKFDWDKYVQEA